MQNKINENIVITCIVIVAAILVFLSVKSCNEEPKPQPPTVEKVLLDTLRAAFTRMEQYNTKLQQKVDSLNNLVAAINTKQQQVKQNASNAIARKNDAKQQRDTVAQLNACDSLEKEHLAYVQYTEQKEIETAAIINTKDDHLYNFKQQTENLQTQVTVLETSNKEKDHTIEQQDKKLKKETKRANRNGILAKIFGGTGALAIILLLIQFLSI